MSISLPPSQINYAAHKRQSTCVTYKDTGEEGENIISSSEDLEDVISKQLLQPHPHDTVIEHNSDNAEGSSSEEEACA